MGFKQLSAYNEEKRGDFFELRANGESANVIFLYRSADDVLVADVHYIKSTEYSGYAHCCGPECPACKYVGKNGGSIRKDSKIFIPLYNIDSHKIEFWDRSIYFEHILTRDVFANYPNPSEFVFSITRHGEPHDRNTTYAIRAVGRNSTYPYEKILADNNMTLPDGYKAVVRELSVADMSRMLNSESSGGPAPTSDFNFDATPRQAYVPASTEIPEPVSVPIPGADVVPEAAPEATSSEEPVDDSTDDLADVDF